jgi:hypothetical protein
LDDIRRYASPNGKETEQNDKAIHTNAEKSLQRRKVDLNLSVKTS